MADTNTIHEMQNLSMFLATQNKIKTDLQKELRKVSINDRTAFYNFFARRWNYWKN